MKPPGAAALVDTALVDAEVVDALTALVSQAAAVILARRAAPLDTRLKTDRSPVTLADVAAEATLLEGLARALPGVPVVSEESAEAGGAAAAAATDFVLLDPLDGTRELLAGRDEFTINLALVHEGAPMFGIVAAPALGLIWRTAGGGAERLRLAAGAPPTAAVERVPIRTRRMPAAGLVAAVSRSHLDPASQAFLAQFVGVTMVACGSALKFCRLAEGNADIYPRLAPTSLWDVGAGHAVLAAAGGTVTRADGSPLRYRPSETLLIPAFIAWGDPDAAARHRR